MTTIVVLVTVTHLLWMVVKRLVFRVPAVTSAEQTAEDAASRVAGKAAALRVLEQLDVSGSRKASPPSSS